MTEAEFNGLTDRLKTKLAERVLPITSLGSLSLVGKRVMLRQSENVNVSVGCELCIDCYVKPEADLWPAIDGQRLLGAEDMGITPDQLDPVVFANLFACPNCRNVLTALIPRCNEAGIKLTHK